VNAMIGRPRKKKGDHFTKGKKTQREKLKLTTKNPVLMKDVVSSGKKRGRTATVGGMERERRDNFGVKKVR